MPEFYLYGAKDGVWLETRIGNWASTEVWAVNKNYTRVKAEFIHEYYWDDKFQWDNRPTVELGEYGASDSAVYLGVQRDFGEAWIHGSHKYGVLKATPLTTVNPNPPKPTPTPTPPPTPTPTPTPPVSGGGGGGGAVGIGPGMSRSEEERESRGYLSWAGDDMMWVRKSKGVTYSAFVKDIKVGPMMVGKPTPPGVRPTPGVWTPDAMMISVRAPVPKGFQASEIFWPSIPVPLKPRPKPAPPKVPPPRPVAMTQPLPPPKPTR